jgi:hypothetical protein
MTDFIPYFAGLITLLFGVGAWFALTKTDQSNRE